jgi:hypothetical protein
VLGRFVEEEEEEQDITFQSIFYLFLVYFDVEC